MKHFAGYAAIGALGVALYLGVLWLLLHVGVARYVAVTAAYAVALTVHFILNRFSNFKAFDRPVHQQAPVYLLTVLVNYLVMLCTVAFGTRYWHMSAFEASVLAGFVTLPIGFLGTRYLAFNKIST